MPERLVKICNPAWVDGQIDWGRTYQTDEEKMGLTIELSRKNVEQQTGEPFGAAIFLCESGQLIAVGVSQVVGQYNSVQHAEMTAIMLAEQKLQTPNLRIDGTPYELFSSCARARFVSAQRTGAVYAVLSAGQGAMMPKTLDLMKGQFFLSRISI